MYNTSNNNRFHLQKKGRKHTCPQCGSKKSFRRYIDELTGKELAEDCGICDHVNRCGYHYPPRELFREHPELKTHDKQEYTPVKKNIQPQVFVQKEFFDMAWVEKAAERQSTFRTWFEGLPFDDDVKQKVLAEYYVGATADDKIINGVNHGPAAVFWMIDEQQRVHDGKMIAYKPDGHRVEGWGNYVRSICEKKKMGPQLQETEKVFFGLHLLNRYPEKTVCIVESEKSALVCACRWPEYIWMATGGCGNLQLRKLRPLMSRHLVVWPDSGEFKKWSGIIQKSGHGHYNVVEMLERYAPNTDIADVILASQQIDCCV